MTLPHIVIGCDISKAHLDLFDAGQGKAHRIANERHAIAAWLAGLGRRDVFVVFEATGGYDAGLSRMLEDADIAFARVNPARARDFARAAGYLAKTDTVDARMLAEMGSRLDLEPEPVSCPQKRRLYGLLRRRDQLVEMRKQEKTRLKQTAEGDIADDIIDHIDALTRRIKHFEQAIAALIETDTGLKDDYRLVSSIPGIGPVTATALLGLMPELGQVTRRAVAALAGLAPLNNDSGLKRGHRSIKGGRRRVRQALYMAAVVATRGDNRFAGFYRTLRSRGAPAKVALIAVARKLLVTANAIMKTRAPFSAQT